MTKDLNKKIFSSIFLFIFFIKMGIAVAPLIAITLDAKSIYAVIMQLEIESSNSSDKVKETAKEYFYNFLTMSLPSSSNLQYHSKMIMENDGHFHAFYPSVPTPPPNV